MISLVPDSSSVSGRALNSLGKLLGLKSETVYSRTILLLVLCQFIVLGISVVFVWLFVTGKFEQAEEMDLLAAADRTKAYMSARSAEAPQTLVSAAATLSGRRVEWRPVSSGQRRGGVQIVRSTGGSRSAVFTVTAPDGRALGEMVVTGENPLFEAGTIALRVFVVGLAVAGGLMLLIMLIVVDRTIVGRIQLLADKVEHEKDSERLPVKLDYPGDDELAMLAHSIEELAILVQRAEREYRHVVEDQTECICRFDAGGRITFSNKAFEVLCQRPPAGKRPVLESLLAGAPHEAFDRAWSESTPDDPIVQFTHAGPGDRWYRSTLRVNFDAEGRRAGGQWIAADVTTEVAAQRRLQDSQRQLAALSARLMTLQDEERRRLARELHDSTSQSLAALEINMSALATTNDAGEAKRLALESGEISRQVVDELRTISYLLHPPLLDEAGLAFAIRWLADGFTKRNEITVFVDIPENFPRLARETETALFRVVQESLSNIYRHAGATKAWITLGGESADVHLEVRDNGKGLPTNFAFERSAGVGLAGMRERMRELGGSLEVLSSEYGVLVKCRLVATPAVESAEQGELFCR